MLDKKMLISIGVPIFNEERNISYLMKSILSQKEINFKVLEIIVVSDGSTDRSIDIVNRFNDKKIKVVDAKLRLGKATRLNQIFKMAKGEIICLFDGDVVLENSAVISKLVEEFIRDSKVALVSGGAKPYPPRTFVEKCVNVSRKAYYRAKLSVHKGNNIFFSNGKILALRRNFAKTVKVPTFITADDAYLYFSCISRGYKFVSKRSAKILFRSPATLRDQIRQNQRYVAQSHQGDIFRKIFGNIVDREYYYPKGTLQKSLILQFVKSPVYSVGIFAINLYVKFLTRVQKDVTRGDWLISTSTKGKDYGK